MFTYETTRATGTANDAWLDGAFIYVQQDTVAPDHGGYGNTGEEAGQSEATHLALRFPELYTDWERDRQQTILWDSYGNTADSAVRIDLFKDGPDGPALVETLAAATEDDGEFNWIPASDGIDFGTHGLRIQVSLASNPAVLDRSTEGFSIPEDTTGFFVNDRNQTGDEYSSAPGSNRNTGRLADAPKPFLWNVLRIYELGPTETVFVDTGDYSQINRTVISAVAGIGDDEGFALTGPTDLSKVALLHHASPLTVAPILELIDADFVSVAHLTLDRGQYGLRVGDSSGNFSGSFLTTSNHTLDGVRIEGGSQVTTLDHVTSFNNDRYGIYIDGPVANASDNTVSANGDSGLYLLNTGDAQVEANHAFGNGRHGIDIRNSVAGTRLVLGNPDLDLGRGNRAHDNLGSGIVAFDRVDVVGNVVFGHPGAGDEGISVGGNGSTVSRNVVHGNLDGIVVDGFSTITENRIYDNTDTGWIGNGGATVSGNVIYSNGVGILAGAASSGTIANNLVYSNVIRGIEIQGGRPLDR